MDTSSHLGYLQARLQARHGERVTDAGWRLLESTPDLASFLQTARATTLRHWISHLPGETDPHTAERSLRQDWRDHVTEIARWSPREWQPAIRWWATLPDLAAMVHIGRGEPVVAWMRDDPILAESAQVDPAQRQHALGRTDLAPVLAAIAVGHTPVAAWLDHWLTLLPVGSDASNRILAALADDVAAVCAPTDLDSSQLSSGRSMRRSLERRFRQIFRRYARTPVAVFAFLAMATLEYGRLRAALTLRAVFPDPAGRP